MAKRRKLIVRTCRNDGIQWYVPKDLQRVRGRLEMFGSAVQAQGEQLSHSRRGLAGRGSTVAHEGRKAANEEATQLQHCPVCGEQAWTERTQDTMPPALEVQLYNLRERSA